MLEIPGEEAPTDPGLQARQRQEAEAKAAAAARARRSRWTAAGGVVAVLLAGAGGLAAWNRSKEAVQYDDPNFFVLPLEDIAEAPADAPPQEAAASATVASNTKAANAARRPTTVSSAPVAGTPRPEGPLLKSATGGLAADAQAGAISTALPGSGTGLGSGAVRIDEGGADAILTDPAEIRDMITRVIGALSPQVQSCYTQRLKQIETLKGAWNVSFTITKAGMTSNVRADGLNGSDADLEACMVRAVSSWRFQKVYQDFPVKKSYRFGAQSW